MVFPGDTALDSRAGPDGREFPLAFPDGAFSESSTFLLGEVFARTPSPFPKLWRDRKRVRPYSQRAARYLCSAGARTGRERCRAKSAGSGFAHHGLRAAEQKISRMARGERSVLSTPRDKPQWHQKQRPFEPGDIGKRGQAGGKKAEAANKSNHCRAI